MNRRIYSGTNAKVSLSVVALAALVFTIIIANPGSCVGTTISTVSIVSCPTDAQIESAVREAVALAGGLPANVLPGKKIVIQPNLVQSGWMSGSGVITDARVVRAVVRMCLERNVNPADITICEGTASFYRGNGGYTDRQATLKAFKDSGLDTNGDMWEDSLGVRMADANNAGSLYGSYPQYGGSYDVNYVTRIFNPNFCNMNRAYYIPNIAAQCDVLIRVPVLKTHNLAGITGALKLAVGFASSDIYHMDGYSFYKWNLMHNPAVWGDELTNNAKAITDLNLCRPADFIVMDALRGVTNGPAGDDSFIPNYPSGGSFRAIFASKDPVAHDTIEALACGYKMDINSIPSLYYSNLKGLGTHDPGRIELCGLHVKDIRRWLSPWGAADPGNQVSPLLGDVSVQYHAESRTITAVPSAYSDSNPGLAKGELYVDGVLVDSTHLAGYGLACSVDGATTGSHTVKYILYDGMLNETPLTKSVNIINAAPIGNSLAKSDGTTVYLGPLVFTGSTPSLGVNTFFVGTEDGSSGLRVQYPGGAPALLEGQRISLNGTLTTIGGQRVLDCASFKLHNMGVAVEPKMMQNRSIGGSDQSPTTPGLPDGYGAYNLGCLIKTLGKVTSTGLDYFVLKDGSLSNGVKVKCGTIAKPGIGSRVIITGLSCTDNDNGVQPMVVLRTASDITPY